MKKRLVLAPILLALSMLFAIGLQSVHEIGHYREWQKERHCTHKENGATNLSHEHSKLDHCPICDFNFAHFTAPSIFQLHLSGAGVVLQRPNRSYDAGSDYFCGSLFALRAPPVFSV